MHGDKPLTTKQLHRRAELALRAHVNKDGCRCGQADVEIPAIALLGLIAALEAADADSAGKGALLDRIKAHSLTFEAVPHRDAAVTQSTEEAYDEGYAVGHNDALTLLGNILSEGE